MSVTWCTEYIYLLGRLDWRGKSEVATNRMWARVRLERIGRSWEGGRVYIIAVKEGLLFFVRWLSLLFKFFKSGFHDLLRLKPPSLFMLFGCISISMASVMRRSLYLVLWKGVWYLVTWWCGQDWSCVQLLLIGQAGPIWYVSHVLLSADGRTVRSVRCILC